MVSIFTTSKIFKNRDILTHKFVPEELPHRENEIREIAGYLSYAIEGSTPPNLLILGHIGVGKTVTILRVLKELKKVADETVESIYVVANGTPFQVLVEIGFQFGCSKLRGLGFLEAWNRLRKRMSDKIKIIVLDEVDKMLRHGSDLLYHLSREDRVCLISISNKLNVMNMIRDSRVTSSYNPIKIVFPKYNAEQLCDILRYRAKLAFYDDVVEEDVIPLCAALAMDRDGDARYALDLLLYAGEEARKQDSEKVCVHHVYSAKKFLEEEFIRKSIMELSVAQKALLHTLATRFKASPREIYEECNKLLMKMGYDRLSTRRLASLLADLELYGFVSKEVRGKGRARGVEWRVKISETVDRSLVLETLKDEIFFGGGGEIIFSKF